MIVNDPSLVMLAFRQAHSCARSPAQRRAIARASTVWRDTPEVGGANGVQTAVGCACRFGVGALFLAAVGDVVEAEAEAQVEAKTGAPIDPQAEKTIEQAVALTQAGADEPSVLAWLQAHSPNKAVYDAGVQAATAMREALVSSARESAQAVAEQARENLTLIMKPADTIAKSVADAQKDGAKIALTLVVGGLALGAFWIYTQSPTRGARSAR